MVKMTAEQFSDDARMARAVADSRAFEEEHEPAEAPEGPARLAEIDQSTVRQEQAELRERLTALQEDNAELLQERGRLSEELAGVRAELARKIKPNEGIETINTLPSSKEIIGRGPALQAVLRRIEMVAPTNATVLIEGETGTGKEIIAFALHKMSQRSERPLTKINCAAIPATLLESDLFGHERGAFTGAHARKLGRFEMAHQGTLFLDEVGDIPLEIQPKLLRVLQEQEFERVGGLQSHRVNVRLLAATSRDLAQMAADRQFRSDLYYRLNVFPLQVPPLRERIEDIPMFVDHFVRKYARQMNKEIETTPSDVMDCLKAYHWPGNVRELQNFIERAVIMTAGKLLNAPLHELKPLDGRTEARRDTGASCGTTGSARAATLEECEREHILCVLNDARWVIGGTRGAAIRLGLKRTTLISKMQKLGITRQPPAPPLSG
jgi:formate hydrogenlyase transcriptional activator